MIMIIILILIMMIMMIMIIIIMILMIMIMIIMIMYGICDQIKVIQGRHDRGSRVEEKAGNPPFLWAASYWEPGRTATAIRPKSLVP